MARTKEEYEADLDLHEVMEFVRGKGAASINEIKNHFESGSRPVRRAVGKLLYHNKIWIIAYGRGVYVTENTGKRGAPNVKALRKGAGTVGGMPGRRGKVNLEKMIPGYSGLSDQAKELVRRELEGGL